MEQEILYLEPRLTIEQLAIKIGVSVKNIRASILVENNQSFNDYINHLRVKKAEKPPDKTLFSRDNSTEQLSLCL